MVTIILPISRTDYLRPVFQCLDELERPSNTELIILTDGDEALQQAVDRRLDSISYSRIQIINFGDSPAESINDRRYRIAAIHNKAKHFIADESQYVFGIEDDTTYPPDTLIKMLDTLSYYEDCAYVEGVELGRHKNPYIGAWRADDVHEPKRIESAMPGIGLEPIDAGGLYCCLTYANLYKLHHFKPYDTVGKNGLGCDLNYGLWLRKQGYTCMVDWNIDCDHIGEKGSVNLGNTKPQEIQFTKDYKGKWSSKVI